MGGRLNRLVDASNPAQGIRAPSGRRLTVGRCHLRGWPQQVVEQRDGVAQTGCIDAVFV